MAKRDPRPTRPISLRLTHEQCARLAAEAGQTPIGVHIRQRLFGSDARTRAIRVPTPRETDLARLLAMLGQSGIATNLRELAEAAHVGALPVTPETEQALRAACDVVEQMRNDLLHALGLRRETYE
ncbi:MAG: hypothetical protein AB7F76_00840 [Parvibaculaceae bacterium]